MLINLAILLPCTTCLVWTAKMFCDRKINNRSQNILAADLLFTSIYFFVVASQLNGAMTYQLDIIDCLFTPLIPPTMYLYFKSLIDERPFGWKDYIWYIPSIVVGVSSLLLYLAMGETDATNYLESFLTHRTLTPEYSSPLYKLHFWISVRCYDKIALLGAIGVSAYAIINIFKYHRRLKDFYSNLENKSIPQNNAVLIWFIISMVFALIHILGGGRPFLERHSEIATLFFIGWAMVYFGLCYSGTKSQYTVENFAKDLQQADLAEICHSDVASEQDEYIEKDNNTVALTQPDKYAKLEVAFDKLMQEKKLFLKNDLRADEVAQLMSSNRIYVAKVIKDKYKCTFSDYINRLRIEYSMELMQSNPELRQDELAEKSGFLSGSTFNKNFKQVVGIPPKEWYRRQSLGE